MGRLPPVPPALKPLQMYLKTADDFDARDLMVAYYCRAYAAKIGISEYLNASTKPYLLQLMDVVEEDKKKLPVTEDAGQAALYNVALKLFKKADDEDRAGRANKKVAQAFYTAMVLFDVLRFFDELNEEESEKHKYAKFKAAYISKCLKEGTVPVAGPMDNDFNPIDTPQQDLPLDLLPSVGGDAAAMAFPPGEIPFPSADAAPAYPMPASYQQHQQPPPQQQQQPPQQPQYAPQQQPGGYPAANNYPPPQQQQQFKPPQQQQQFQPPPQTYPQQPPARPQQQFQPPPQQQQHYPPPQQQQQQYPPPQQQQQQKPAVLQGNSTYTPKQHVEIRDNEQAKKFCKFAISALEYNDTRTAVDNLLKALNLLSN